jgi:hypothetical protein
LGEGAAPVISFPSIQLRFTGLAGAIAGFSVQHKKKRPMSLNRPPNVKKLAIDRFL